MNLSQFRVRIVPGAGLVAHHGTALLLALPEGPVHEGKLDEILALVEEVTSDDPATPGRKLARRIVGMLSAAEPDDVPSFGLLAVADQGVVVLLHGAVDLDLGVSGEHLSGRTVSTWIDRIIDGDIDELAMHGSDRGATVDPRSDLRAGVVAGDGVVVARRTGASPAPVVTPAPLVEPPDDETAMADAVPVVLAPPPSLTSEPEAPPAEFSSVSLSDPLPAEALQPLPLAQAAPAAATDGEAGAVSGVEVLGYRCKRDHFNDPDTRFCSSCGIAMGQVTNILVPGIRPPLGILVFDDGSVFVLDSDYVVGREPAGHADVRSGAALPLLLADPHTSREHAHVHLDGWVALLIDLGSANGSYIAAAEATEWTRLTPHTPVPIAPGARVLVGGRNFVFESHHRA